MEAKHNLVLKYNKQIIKIQQLCALTQQISTSTAAIRTALAVKDVLEEEAICTPRPLSQFTKFSGEREKGQCFNENSLITVNRRLSGLLRYCWHNQRGCVEQRSPRQTCPGALHVRASLGGAHRE